MFECFVAHRVVLWLVIISSEKCMVFNESYTYIVFNLFILTGCEISHHICIITISSEVSLFHMITSPLSHIIDPQT